MVVCAMQRFATEQQLPDCNAMKSTQTAQLADAGIVDNGNGAEEDDDREEGEIVDEFEMIISSEDEEFKLRARIQQLEDKSKDIEKMDMLSANLANQYNFQRPHRFGRYTQYQHFSPITVLSDVSSLSEEDEQQTAPKKHRKHKTKRMESKKYSPQLRRNPFANRQRSEHKKRRHERHNNQYNQQAANPLDSLEDDMAEYAGNVENELADDYEELEQLKLSRDELRVALARTENYDIRPKHSLKERLQYRLRKSPSPIFKETQCKPKEDSDKITAERQEQQQQQQEDSQLDDQPELKLRIIALKSAILKKHMARKKRDAERAYSPTDMINRVHPPTINNECEDIDDLMEISPAASPERAVYSPPRFAEPVDMDLAQTDSDEDRQQWPHNWQSTVNNCNDNWHCYLPNSLPPVTLPIIIDDEEEEPQLYSSRKHALEDDDEVPPPPPSYHIPHMQLEDEDARDGLHLIERCSPFTDIQSISMDNSQTQTQTQCAVESSDEEAAALRALLLSRRKPNAAKVTQVQAVQKDANAHDSDDADELRLLLLSSIANKRKNSSDESAEEKPEILKKAVLRFQVTASQLEAVEQGEAREEKAEQISDTAETLTATVPTTVPPTAPIAAPLAVPITSLPTPISTPIPAPVSTPIPAPTPTPPPLPVPPPEQPEVTPIAVISVPTINPPTIPAAPNNIIKIVKPNKVINKKTAPKRKLTKVTPPVAPPLKRPTTLLVKETLAPLHSKNNSSTTRLITTMDPATIKVNKLVITLAESSAGSDDELELRSCYAYSYADNPSPLSQTLDSASNSTTRSNTPNSEIIGDATAANSSDLRRTVINEYFEKKLDDFLKQARSKVPTTAAQEATENAEKLPEKTVQKSATVAATSNKTKPTPVAVRHLPVASQKEYLRLIERMQLLEQKKVMETAKGAATAITAFKAQTAVAKQEVKRATAARIAEPKANGTTPKTTTSVESDKSDDQPTTSKTTLTMPSKESRLKAFENSFHKIGSSMIANLEKSVHMVSEARNSKVARLRYSHRFEELFAEMQSVKQAMKLEGAKLARIQPEIQATHEIIISLKQKRNKLRNAAMDLGNGLQGTDYRLLDPCKAEIKQQSTQLTKEIRLYNTIATYEDTLTLDKDEQETRVETSAASTPQSMESAESPKEVEPEMELALELEQQEQPQAIECEPAIAAEATEQLDAATKDNQAKTKQNVPPNTVSFMRELCSGSAASKDSALLGEYRSAMPRNYKSGIDVHATLCPFELMGRCEDVDCSYLHLTRVDSETINPIAS